MIALVLATTFFVGIHVFISGTRLRDTIVARMGPGPFRGLFSLLSIGGIVWLVRAYGAAPYVETWGTVPPLRPVTAALMVLAFELAVVGLLTPSPTAVGGEAQLDEAEPARGILRITRHPFLWGAAIWAFTHLVANGDAASLVLFGGLLLLALLGVRSIDAKRAAAFGERWERFAAVTSSVPFAAIVQGRNTLVLGELGGWRLAAGLALFAAFFFYLHARLFGVAPLP